MDTKIKVAAVSYLNTKPLLFGIERNKSLLNEIDLLLDYPALLAKGLQENTIDMALVPVAAIPSIPNARIVSDYGIAADGKVASVCIFSHVPMEQIETVYLDYQSRSSVNLARILLKEYWKKDVVYKQAPENYIDYIGGTTAGVIIGDRALKQLTNFEYIYDLAEAWKDHTGLPFIFAAWVANKELPQSFLERFNEANAVGLDNLREIIKTNPFPYYNLETYYTENIQYQLDERKRAGMRLYWEKLSML